MDTAAQPQSFYRASSSHLRCATDGGMIFASTKCPPPGGEEDTTCSLPFGFCYTPMMILPQQLSSISQPLPAGVMCTTCLAYINLYCTFSPNDGGWICALCHSRNFIDQNETNNGIFNTVMSQRVVEFHQSLSTAVPSLEPLPSSPPPRMKTMLLVVDQHLPALEAQAIGTALRKLLSTDTSVVWHFGLILFGQMISIVQVGLLTGMVICDTVRSHEGFTVVAEMDHEGSTDLSRYFSDSLDALIMCLNALFDVTKENHHVDLPVASSSETSKKSRLEILKERKLARMHRSDQTEEHEHVLLQSPWTAARERAAHTAPPHRFSGDAMQCAVDMASMATTGVSSDSRILLFTNGCPNLGDGSVVDVRGEDVGSTAAYSTVDASRLARACEYFSVLAQSAVEVANIGIDVLCTGSSELGLPAYQSLVEPSAGYVLSHDTFTSSNLEVNLQFLLHQTHLTRAYFVHPANDAETSSPTLHSAPPPGAWMSGCTVDIRVSR
jgi:Sec23/Sec24 zinc finger/Sec23/Sec24 trunk domain